MSYRGISGVSCDIVSVQNVVGMMYECIAGCSTSFRAYDAMWTYHCDYSSSHGIRLTKAEEIMKVSELFNVQGFCEHVGYIFTSIDISAV